MEKINEILISAGFVKAPLPPERNIPVGPKSKLEYPEDSLAVKQLYCNNESTTSLYTWYGFVFANLYEQSQRIANFYFICLAIVNFYTDAPVSPLVSIIPLVFVIMITMFKEGYEDWLRHKADKEVNNVIINVVDTNGYMRAIKSMDINVGDVILCTANMTFPCDLVLLSSVEPTGECFVTTASLDGETNLKKFNSLSVTKSFDSAQIIKENLVAKINCQQPTSDLYSFVGNLEINQNGKKQTVPIGNDNVVLRGARLRNTDYIYGCAIYTGKDTKIMQNSQEKKTKFSCVENKLNFILLILLIALLTVCIIYTIFRSVHLPTVAEWYISSRARTAWNQVQDFLGSIILFNYLIPISLYVTIEVVKFLSTNFFAWDTQLYDEDIDQPALANTSDILEEIGQIEYLFSDKTGTLTQNNMVFKRFAVQSGTYNKNVDMLFMEVVGDPNNSIRIEPKNQRDDVVALLMHIALCHTVRVELCEKDESPLGNDVANFSQAIKVNKKFMPRRNSSINRRAKAAKSASNSFRNVRTGRAVPVEIEADTSRIDYQASSPDEKAFVEACRDLSIVYHGVDKEGLHTLTIKENQAFRYRLLELLDFDSERKCMTVILQIETNEKGSKDFDASKSVLILTKGAENSMVSRMQREKFTGYSMVDEEDYLMDLIFKKGPKTMMDNNGTEIGMTESQLLQHVQTYAECGLRTLVMGARLVDSETWQKLGENVKNARSHMGPDRDRKIQQAFAEIERDLTIIGCTGIEDKLQDGVNDTITSLRMAGINIWVLTGDKEETAINISFSAGHFWQGLNILKLTKLTDTRSTSRRIDKVMDEMRKIETDDNAKMGLVVDGQTLSILMQAVFREKFLFLCQKSSTVLCCRLSPSQKADVVRLIKNSKKTPPITAAIGDGANDVPMIMEANVGFGLFGREGRQAVRSADYAFGKFKFLKRVVLFHGSSFYERLSTMIKYFFYKNLVFTVLLGLYGIHSKFSTQSLYASIYMMFYNLFMTSLPTCVYGIMEKPTSEKTLLKYPHLFREKQHNSLLQWKYLAQWLTLAVYHSLVIYFVSVLMTEDTFNALSSMETFGTFLLTTVFFVVTIKLLLSTRMFHAVFVMTVTVTIIGNILIFVIANFISTPLVFTKELEGVWDNLWTGYGVGVSYFGCLLILVLALLPDVVMRTYKDQKWAEKLQHLHAQDEKERKIQLTSRSTRNKTKNRIRVSLTKRSIPGILKKQTVYSAQSERNQMKQLSTLRETPDGDENEPAQSAFENKAFQQEADARGRRPKGQKTTQSFDMTRL